MAPIERAGEEGGPLESKSLGGAGAGQRAERQAKELFLLVYAVKDTLPDEAVQKMKEVIEMTPPSDETHLKAVSWVEKLSK